ncbi:Na+/H+ antiporter NhaC family protein [Gordonibacter urolithinfaciens]|uniref:Na+/H+ antiporter NhaC family protein n=1 Tax=Gordonibacter urolithinfaciens TaxID=1335613 RepID=A0A6N8IJH9_9ACTN|nr:Na+/H+ antiporter NhaC family protein [Gordonibacter urolithinfaciens]MVM56226.1 Na+/H+ antiporter NhaC family protein [Gordonibacter urolithinfaciens]MVN16017.1 Na+/H+ antiporter NhaC family protein [Gordonibacter urolithinfaciens]MVN39391.1 Na+/H+ antiporter NhaC family protein [Gordonibacter urolithinfaciens]MVN57132.1 Na+/H+ antiporter NhaC family protein [Gordonibacter urolithinfaciens]MVN62771.1 Na+/H+ antiporter NhaC family protein [Gordonibacter urolithinfaciens]
MEKGNVKALLPIGVFLVLYLGLGVLFEYGMGIPMGFYNIPIVVIFLVALLVACVQNRKLPFDDKLVVMGRGIGDKTIVTMVLIFMAAGIFVGTVGRDSAESVAYLMLSVIPAEFSVLVLFVVSCFVSLAMGTSVGTITLITPIAVAVSTASGFDLPLCVASVMGGAMFGDNLSFISDTTIAACQGQGCQMKDKFRENFKIAVPAALATLAIILALSLGSDISGTVSRDYDLIQLVPYLIVLVGGIVGVNVFVVLLLGILSGSLIMVATGATAATDLLASMGSGAAGMFETTMVAVLVSAICALIREYGGFTALLNGIKSLFKSKKGGQLGMGLLVGAMDIATANNTVAIVIANPIAADMAETYDISRRKTASILDTFSCVFQGVIPYGAQMLVAISAAAELGYAVSAFQIMPFLFYPFLLLASSLVFIFLVPDKRGHESEKA